MKKTEKGKKYSLIGITDFIMFAITNFILILK